MKWWTVLIKNQPWFVMSPVTELLLSMFSGRADFRLRRALEELPNIFGAAVPKLEYLFSI